jgi:4-amino-4-deoxy-L-arabinose transferase-like glycosyltransferase
LAETPIPGEIESPLDIRTKSRIGQAAEKLSSVDGLVSLKGLDLLLLVMVAVCGLLLRFHMLGAKSLWPDEAFSVHAARLPWLEFLRTMWWGEGNMALYYFLLRGWIHLGNSEFWLRTMTALFGVITLPAIYALGTRFLSRKAGAFAAVLMATHSFHVHYSQELRSYSLLTLLLILSAYAFLAMLETPEQKSFWFLYVAFSALAVYTHMFAVFVFVSQWLTLTPNRVKRLGIVKLLCAGAAIVILTAPIAAEVVTQHKDQLNWVPSLSLTGIFEVFQDLVGAVPVTSHGSVRSLAQLGLYGMTWAVGLGCFLQVRKEPATERKKSSTLALLVSWLTFPVLAMAAISFFKPIWSPRYLLMCVPAAVLLASEGLVAIEGITLRARGVSSALFATMFGLALFATRDYFASFKTYGHDGRAVAQYVLSKQEPGDAVIFYTFSQHYVFEYYLMREKEAGSVTTAPAVLFPLDLERSKIEKRTAPYGRIWLVLHQTRRTPVTDVRTETIRAALEPHFRLAGEREFPGSGVDRGESGTIRVLLYIATAPNQMTVRSKASGVEISVPLDAWLGHSSGPPLYQVADSFGST